ncbi:hypothetical protein CH249_01890 [Rhodococcus sp. 05-2255-3B1]|uniref:hypothetical protein n=1 Tax=unclassified Rhodococcus (in: high G+C Gram-positive bacteria) TaxID=192944 RepID=UPI000B9A6F32|nr:MULTISPECIES: hypothetical protein [unclassified Rhodococcus (in: high G+C Gram-positive bacteria)]OZE13365.1 hypothetical protein CH250_05475 [Rhodococcus sp. 05-2255-3C]OZE16023.1 hypothetical protein CH249_01890 [Rhodococcus sp. 05-2255-3B1]OZE19063.1 hypothetical protein CH255_13915 [Rhodococcus sp. 05-2255-2A2]
MSNSEREYLRLRAMAMQAEMEAAKLRFAAAAVRASAAMRAFAEAYQDGFDAEVAQHPDLAELNVQMDSFYPDASRS